MIRVRSELLDSLVNYAGEVSIYRSRLEQQVGSFRFNLVELEQTTQRLRDQLRKLEIETEAQILSRYQREAEESGQDFDPLELDRFSTQQQLSRALAESVSDLLSLQSALDDLTRGAETLLLQQSRVSSELQEGLMRTRMVPFDSVVPFLRRLIRQTADVERKRANLRIEGAQGEMDRNLLERMKAPFEHMLRNAVAHGIEPPAERLAAGKPEEGTVRIAVSREATEVVIRVTDDGRGMDRDAIRRKAIERGLMRPDAQLSDRDLFAFVTETGFSTATTTDQVKGRGIGMDVVASEIRQLGGTLSIDSQRGKGAEFTVRLPFTLAVTQAILVRLGDQAFAVPMSSVQGVARIARDDFDRRIGQAHPVFAYAGEEFTIHELNGLLGVPGARATDEAQLPLLLARSGDQRAAIRVDGVLGSREIVVKSVGPQVNSVPGIFGATIMGDGSVVMILDLAPLVRRSAAMREENAVEAALEDAMPGLMEAAAPVAPVPEVEARRQPLVMVVDDSITMRKVTSRVLERNDMEVVTAKDGLDAVEKLQDRVPDLVLLDIEMPRMDGYELATYMRNDSRLKAVPIIMITSRTGEKHRQRAFDLGVNRYLGKPYQEVELMRNVFEMLGVEPANA
jgi:chemosensory pili system protein ChpA (sensor histidine kinase/response regulator)